MSGKEREKATVLWMIRYNCLRHHGTEELCENCQELLGYSIERIDKCPEWPNKPPCTLCTTHCYKKRQREEIRLVMRFAGPRMLFHRPLAAIEHIFKQLTYRKLGDRDDE